ncbi:MAG: acyl--CoA ligase [Candidatus Obscuribacterales bacterium]|nr:acyl--CoA ligase [Candidatus Obscuribacterales bacterium]
MIVSKPSARDLLFENPIHHGERIAVAETDTKSGKVHFKETSYKQLYALVDKFEAGLEDRGIGKGDRIVLLGRNNPAMVASLIACWRKQAIAMPIDFRLTQMEVLNIADKVEAKLVIVAESYPDQGELNKQLNERKLPNSTFLEFETQAGEPCKTRESGSASSCDFDFQALVILTSGTTGMPKGAVHTFSSLIENLKELTTFVKMDENKQMVLPLPISHIFGLEILFITLLFGGKVILSDLDPASMIACINNYKPQIIAGVPTIYGALLSAGADKVDLSDAEVLLSGGAPLPINMARQFEAEFGRRLNNGYGSTESKLICLNIDGPLESIGRPIPSARINVIGSDGKTLAEGLEGEVFIDCPLVMQGYLDQPEKSQDVLTENGYKTGDIGYVKDGFVFISGRAKEMIIVAGNKVFPFEVEDALSKHPLVKEVAVTGVDHSRLGQIVKATLVIGDCILSEKLCGQDKSSTREEILTSLKKFSKESLKRELRPMVWELRPLSEPLPKTRTGKIDKKLLS